MAARFVETSSFALQSARFRNNAHVFRAKVHVRQTNEADGAVCRNDVQSTCLEPLGNYGLSKDQRWAWHPKAKKLRKSFEHGHWSGQVTDWLPQLDNFFQNLSMFSGQMKRWNMNHVGVSPLQIGQIFQCQRCLWLFFSRPCRDMLCDQRWKCSATNGFGASSKPLGQDFEILNGSMESRRTMISTPNKSTWKGLEGFTAIIWAVAKGSGF